MPYITKDQAGNITGIFENSQYEGQEYTEDAVELWVDPKDAARAEIDRLLKGAGLNQKWQVQSAMSAILALIIVQGGTEEFAYANHPGYKQAKDLLTAIELEEAKL